MLFLRAVQFWIIVSTLASVAGWTLSALGMLNKTGYAIFAAVVAVIAFAFRKSTLFSPLAPPQTVKKLRNRFRKFLPAGFAMLAVLAFLGGCLYNAYEPYGTQLPAAARCCCNGFQHGRWFWIHTPNYRMNDRACGIEWLSAPLLLFLKSDRALFLLNFIPFILMPGLIFWLNAVPECVRALRGTGCGSFPPATVSCCRWPASPTCLPNGLSAGHDGFSRCARGDKLSQGRGDQRPGSLDFRFWTFHLIRRSLLVGARSQWFASGLTV